MVGFWKEEAVPCTIQTAGNMASPRSTSPSSEPTHWNHQGRVHRQFQASVTYSHGYTKHPPPMTPTGAANVETGRVAEDKGADRPSPHTDRGAKGHRRGVDRTSGSSSRRVGRALIVVGILGLAVNPGPARPGRQVCSVQPLRSACARPGLFSCWSPLGTRYRSSRHDT